MPVVLAVPAEEQDGDGDRTGGGGLPKLADEIEAVRVGHREVGDHDVRVEQAVNTLHCLRDRLDTHDRGARPLDEGADELSRVVVVFHDQHPGTGQERERSDSSAEHGRSRTPGRWSVGPFLRMKDGRAVALHGRVTSMSSTRGQRVRLGSIDGAGRIQRQPWQINREDASSAGDVAGLDLAAIRADALTGDSEPEAQTASVLASLLEQCKQVLGSSGKAAALVLDRDEDAIGVCVCPYENMTRGARELESVLQQVRDRRREGLSVYLDRNPLGDGGDGELQAPSLRFDRRRDFYLFDELGERDSFPFLDPRFEAYLGERAVDEVAHARQVAAEHGARAAADADADADASTLENLEGQHGIAEQVPQLGEADLVQDVAMPGRAQADLMVGMCSTCRLLNAQRRDELVQKQGNSGLQLDRGRPRSRPRGDLASAIRDYRFAMRGQEFGQHVGDSCNTQATPDHATGGDRMICWR